jgi:hypothetical protein
MTLTGIDAAKSKEGEIFFRTDPPMTQEVLQGLQTAWILGNEFDMDGDLLVWRGGAYPEKSLRQQTDIFLTEAENAIKTTKRKKTSRNKPENATKARKPGKTNRNQEFLQKVSEQTGLPLV